LIHPTAIVHPDARIAEDASIGPHAVIEEGVEIGAGTRVDPFTVIRGPTRIGRDNRIHQFCSLGDDPQDKKYRPGEHSELLIGAGNVIREYCSINRGPAACGGRTMIGDGNWIMANVHIAHDCIVGNQGVFANHATLAGHVVVEDHVTLGGFTGVRQFCRIGAYGFTAAFSAVTRDTPPYLSVSGNKARPIGINQEGLRRHGFKTERIATLKTAYRLLYREGLRLCEALERLDELASSSGSDDVAKLTKFIRARGRPVR